VYCLILLKVDPAGFDHLSHAIDWENESDKGSAHQSGPFDKQSDSSQVKVRLSDIFDDMVQIRRRPIVLKLKHEAEEIGVSFADGEGVEEPAASSVPPSVFDGEIDELDSSPEPPAKRSRKGSTKGSASVSIEIGSSSSVKGTAILSKVDRAMVLVREAQRELASVVVRLSGEGRKRKRPVAGGSA
jgi:hypothetical protein